MTERGYEELAGRMLEAYDIAEEKMLRDVASRLSRGITQPGWAERKLSEVTQAHEAVRKALVQTHKECYSGMGEAVTKAYGESQQRWMLENADAVKAMGILHPNAIKAANILSELDSSITAAERVILRRFDDAYADVIGKSAALVETGAYTSRQAVNIAMRDLSDRGITTFTDRAGRAWNLASYTEMAVLTAVEKANVAGYIDTMQSYGYDLAVISAHAGSCPLCAAWENVVVSVSGNDKDYPSLDEAEAAGVFHPRCLHDIYTYHEELDHGQYRSEPREVEPPSAEYTARSEQRYMERQIRKYKSRMSAAITPQAERQAYNKVRQWQANLRQHLKDNSKYVLPRKYWREGGRITLSDSAKQLTNDIRKGIINLPNIKITRSVSARGRNYWVLDFESGKEYQFVPDTYIKNVQVFAGKGTNTIFRQAGKYAEKYGGEPSEWQHVKGIGQLRTEEADREAEVHWVQCKDIGRFEFFVKRWLDE